MEEEYFNIRGYQFKFVNQGLLFFSNGDWRLDGEYDTFKQEAAEDIVNDYHDMQAYM